MAKVNINDVLQGLIQPIGSLKGGSTYPVTAADQIWVYTDRDTHRPLDEYLDTMKTEVAETTQTFVSNATALTEGKIAKTSIVGGRAAKCKVGDIVMVADGNIYKISAIDETNITLALPALASYAPAAAIKNRVLHGDLKDATGAPSYPSGGGGGGVSPRLNLMDRSDYENPTVRTSITEAEKINIEKGWYNSVLYIDTSLGETAVGSLYLPENALFTDGAFVFSIYKVSMDTATYSISIKTASIYQLDIEEKDTDGTYPITIEKLADCSIGGGGGSGTSLLNLRDLSSDTTKVRTSITEEEKANIQAGVYTSVLFMNPDDDTGEFSFLNLFWPGQALLFMGYFVFSTYKWASDGNSIVGSNVYALEIGDEKNEDGTYPITVEPFLSAPFAGIKITFKD